MLRITQRLFKLIQTFLSLSFVLYSPSLSFAENSLRWGADAESGAPYMFRDPEHPELMRGFEKDIMEELARRLGKQITFVQVGQWDALIPTLLRGDLDLAANGIEITEDRKKEVIFTDPYLISHESIAVRKDSALRRFQDLKTARVGTLKGSLAREILIERLGVTPIYYDEESPGIEDVSRGRLDAFFADQPIIEVYAPQFKNLVILDEPVGRLEYGIALKKRDKLLLEQLNQALREMKSDGSLEKILSRWGVLDAFSAREMGLHTPNLSEQATEIKKLNFKKEISWNERMERYKKILPFLLQGAQMTLIISVLSMIVAMLVGIGVALARLSSWKILRFLSTCYIEFFRGTPLLIQLFLIYFGLPYLGLELSPMVAAVIGLGLNYAACEGENYRAGIQSVPKQQWEAAQALALRPAQRFGYVILPQASRVILPPMTNDFIALLKDSSLVSTITLVELTTLYSQFASTYFDHLGLGLLVAGIYFLMGFPFVRLARSIERANRTKLS